MRIGFWILHKTTTTNDWFRMMPSLIRHFLTYLADVFLFWEMKGRGRKDSEKTKVNLLWCGCTMWNCLKIIQNISCRFDIFLRITSQRKDVHEKQKNTCIYVTKYPSVMFVFWDTVNVMFVVYINSKNHCGRNYKLFFME